MWSKWSWRNYPAFQQPQYDDLDEYNTILKEIESYPSLVFAGEVDALKRHIAAAGEGKAFILQGGDCVERFIDCDARTIENKLKILLQMSVVLTYAIKRPVVRIGRIAGQFSKPRSKETERIGGKEMLTYRGDSVNSYAPGAQRKPDPRRLLKSFYHAGITLNHIRALVEGGFADLHQPYNWNLYEMEQSSRWSNYKEIVERVLDAINFMESFGGINPEKLDHVEFYISHEGLLLGYEEAVTKKDPRSGSFYNLGTHMLWIGERTRNLNGGHVEYFRGIENPVGVKISSKISRQELVSLIKTLNPGNERGKLMLISRFGAAQVESHLPGLIKTVKDEGLAVTWSCDPMHGNTVTSRNSELKTRNFDSILKELELTLAIHNELESHLGGVHFELTGENVTECIGGAADIKEIDLHKNYQTFCDPRLNYNQSMEMAFLIARLYR